MGIPRYVQLWSVVGIPNIPATYFFIRQGVLGENHNLDLVTLTSWPKESQKNCRILHKFLQSLALALVKRKISSAKNKCERRTLALKFIRWISLSWTTSSNLIDNHSKQRINRYGDRGSPCLTPRLGTTSRRGAPFHKIWNWVDESIFIMSVMRFGGIWKNYSVSLRKDHSNRSYAFSRSNFIATYPFRPLLDFNVRITSWMRIILSLVRNPDTNPTWQGLFIYLYILDVKGRFVIWLL